VPQNKWSHLLCMLSPSPIDCDIVGFVFIVQTYCIRCKFMSWNKCFDTSDSDHSGLNALMMLAQMKQARVTEYFNDGWWFVEVWSDRDGLVVLFWWLIVFADTTHILSLLFCGLVVPWWPIRCRRQLANEACCDAGQYWTWFQTNRLIDCIDSMVRSSSNPHCFLYCKHRLSGFCRSMQHWILHAVAKA
jgi:hypothetical protein